MEAQFASGAGFIQRLEVHALRYFFPQTVSQHNLLTIDGRSLSSEANSTLLCRSKARISLRHARSPLPRRSPEPTRSPNCGVTQLTMGKASPKCRAVLATLGISAFGVHISRAKFLCLS